LASEEASACKGDVKNGEECPCEPVKVVKVSRSVDEKELLTKEHYIKENGANQLAGAALAALIALALLF